MDDCTHQKYSDGHCAVMVCWNYSSKCPKHAPSGSDSARCSRDAKLSRTTIRKLDTGEEFTFGPGESIPKPLSDEVNEALNDGRASVTFVSFAEKRRHDYLKAQRERRDEDS